MATKRKTRASEQPADEAPAREATEARRDLDESLRHSLLRDDEAKARVVEMRSFGLSDELLQAWICEQYSVTDSVADDGYSYSFGTSDEQPCFWFVDSWPAAPTLQGQALVDEVRRVLEIPLPKADAADDEHTTEAHDDSPEKLSLERIAAANRVVLERHTSYLEAKSVATSAKKLWESAVEQLQEVIREETEAQAPNLFNQPRAADPGAPIVPTEPSEDESWKQVPLAELSLPDGLLQKLGDAGIATVGELQAYQEPHPTTGYIKRLTDIPGVGPAAVEKIDAAMTQFWTDWNQRQGTSVMVELPEAEPEDDDEDEDDDE